MIIFHFSSLYATRRTHVFTMLSRPVWALSYLCTTHCNRSVSTLSKTLVLLVFFLLSCCFVVLISPLSSPCKEKEQSWHSLKKKKRQNIKRGKASPSLLNLRSQSRHPEGDKLVSHHPPPPTIYLSRAFFILFYSSHIIPHEHNQLWIKYKTGFNLVYRYIFL